jgi:hypothetical protein
MEKIIQTHETTRHVILPPIGQKVMVQCEGYRGLAYRNNGTQWRAATNHKNLPNDIEILSPAIVFAISA